jgi:hypothetical protein
MTKIPCPYCKGEVLSEQNGRVTSSMTLFPRMQNVLNAITDFLNLILGGPKVVSRKEAMGGKCETCGDTGYIEDATDTSEQDQAAADYLHSKSDRILLCEAKQGNSPGGNMITRVAGVKIDIVGKTLNNADAVTVHEGKAAYRFQNKVTAQGRALPIGPKKGEGGNVVTSNNPPANSGGLYFIQCGNKFKVVAGAQGIELHTKGVISIDGGMTRFTGAEVTIGSGVGPVSVCGDNLLLQGNKAVNIHPGTGSVNIDGSLNATADIIAGGGYVDNFYFVNATCPEKQDTTKISAQTDGIGGPAVYGGLIPKLQPRTVANAAKWIKDTILDPTFAKTMGPFNPRSILKTRDNITNIIYSKLPQEVAPTGFVYGVMPGPGAIPIFNFPHSHAQPDGVHSHHVALPGMNFKGHTAESVRGEYAAAGGNNPKVPTAAAGAKGDPFNTISSVVQAGNAVVETVGDLFSYSAVA